MNYSYSQISDFDVFFYYGESDIELENQSDIMWGVMQPKRSMYYNRREGCGLPDRVNEPNTIQLTIVGRYDITQWVGYRNTYVTNGQNGNRDRRVAVSQQTIAFKQNDKGEVDIEILYIPFSTFKQPSILTIPVGL